MDCVCTAENTALDAVLDPKQPFIYALQRGETGYSLQTLEESMVISDFKAMTCSGQTQLVVGNEVVVCVQSANTMGVYANTGYKGTFSCTSPIPYSLDRISCSPDFLYFSTSQSIIYACPSSSISQLAPDRSLLKLKLPKGTQVLSMQQKPATPAYLAAACSDGLVRHTQIRVWNVLSQEEEIGIIDPAKDIGLSKKVISKLIKTEVYPAINCIDFTVDGARLLAGSQSGVVNIWRTERLPNT